MADKQSYNKKLKHFALVQAAKEMFLEKPYSSINMDEIVKLAGVTKKTLYSYFPSKLALFTNMFEDYLRELHSQLTEAFILDKQFDKAFRKATDILFQFTKKNEKFMRFFWALDTDDFNGDIPQELIQRVKIWNKAMLDEMVGLIEKGQNEGVIADCDPEMLVHLLSAANKGIFIHANKQSKFNIANIDPEKLYKMFIEIIIKQFVMRSSEELTKKQK